MNEGPSDQGNEGTENNGLVRDHFHGPIANRRGGHTSVWQRFAVPVLILLCAAVASAPVIVRGPSCGHDFDFHLVSWLDALDSWRHGTLYPHWTPSPNYGAGEPRFIFYPPLTWMLGAALGLMLPWSYVPLALIFLLLAATGIGTRALALQRFARPIATLAGCTAIFSGYALFTAYERSAYAEMTAGLWVPLMLLLILRDPRRSANLPASIPLTLVVAGAWLSNAPLGVMLSYLLAGVAITVAALRKSWAPLFRAAIALVLGLGLSAFYLVPAAWEQRWVAIRQAVYDPGLLIENSWLFARHADPALHLHDIELFRVSWIAITMITVALLGLAISRWRRTLTAEPAWWIPLALIPVIVLFLQLPLSEPAWRVLPKLRFLQFPWRWLAVLEPPMAIFFAAAVWAPSRLKRGILYAVCATAFVAATAFAASSLFLPCDSEDAIPGMLDAFRTQAGFEGTDEYAPPDADNSVLPDNLPFACLVRDPAIVLGNANPPGPPDWAANQGTCDAAVQSPHAGPGTSSEHLRLQGNMPHAGYLVLRLRTYPAWKVRVNGMPPAAMPTRDDGLMAVPVPQGHIILTADWITTPDVRLGRLISIASLLLVTGLWLGSRRRSRPRLS